MQVIGVAAQLANGKDALCDYLVERLNQKCEERDRVWGHVPRWQRSAFADAVKEVFESAFGVDREFTEQWKRNPEPPPGMLQTVRKSLQFIGDGFRQIKDDIWIDIALQDESKKLVISDSRYINEAKAVKAKGGIMIILYRPGFLNDDPNPSEAQIRPIVDWCVANISEGPITDAIRSIPGCPDALQYYDYFLVNEGSLEDLYAKADRLLIPFIEEKYKMVASSS